MPSNYNQHNVKLPTFQIHTGKDGWLFLTGGTNRLIEYYTELGRFNPKLVAQWESVLSARHAYFRKKAIRYVHIFAPNKLTIYPEHYDGTLDHFNDHPINAFFRGVNKTRPKYLECLINPITYFIKKKRKLQLFWKTDSHWSFHGCYSAYELICSKLGLGPNTNLLDRSFVEQNKYMDLGATTVPPVKERVRSYKILENATRVFANDIVKFKEENDLHNAGKLHVGSNVVFTNKNFIYDKKVVLFGTSFSEYRPKLLTAMLAETFSETHFIWSARLDFGYIERVCPDIVISEIVERFMPRVPTDTLDLDAFVKERLDEYRQNSLIG